MTDPAAAAAAGVGRRFAILGTGEAVARLTSFATTIYIARVLGAEWYGVIGFATAITLYLTRFADFGIEYFGLGAREIAGSPRVAGSIVPSVTILRLAVAVGIAAILGIVAMLTPHPEAQVLALYGLTLISLAASTRWALLGLERPTIVAASRVLGEMISAVLVFSLVRSSTDILSVPLAQFAGDAAGAALLLFVLWRLGLDMRMRLDWSVVRPLMGRSWRLIVSAVLGLSIYNSDLILLRFFRDSASVGLYAAAYTFISFLLNLGGAYYHTLLPAMARDPEEGSRGSLYQTGLSHVFTATIPVAVGGYFVASSLVLLLFGADYASAARALEILVWSIPLALMREVATAGLMTRRGESHVLRLTAWTASANLLLNVALIPSFGIAGAAFATVLTEALRFGSALILAHRVGYSPVSASRLWKPALAAVIMAGVLQLAQRSPLPVVLAAGALTYATGLAALQVFSSRRRS